MSRNSKRHKQPMTTIAKTVNFLSKRVGNFQYNPTSFMLIDQLLVR
jgi:hypothetical protein